MPAREETSAGCSEKLCVQRPGSNDHDVAPCRPEAAEQDPKYSILDSQPRVRLFSLEYGQLLTEGKNLKGKVVARTEESAEAAEDEKWNHGTGFIA